MQTLANIEPIDYLVVGHVTQDLLQNGTALGGTASYASLTARAFGLRVGIVTSCTPDLALDELSGIRIIRKPSQYNSTFENIKTPEGRVQIIHHQAEMLTPADIPEQWLNTPIVHLGPVDCELDPALADCFPNSLLGVTPQGWMRRWDENGRITYGPWLDYARILKKSSATVISVEDVQKDEDIIQEMVLNSKVFVVTEGSSGSRLYWNNDLRYFHALEQEELDPTGAGDIFAASFFIRLAKTRDPWEADRFATRIAAHSVTRKALKGVPTPSEINKALVEVLND